jgi:hypothetical protein
MRLPLNRLEIAHTITHVPNRKKKTGERKTQCSWEMEVNIEDMEVDDVDRCLPGDQYRWFKLH